MHLHGIVMSGDLAENPTGSDRIELSLRIQGVGPGQPRRIVVPYDLLLADPTLDPETVTGHAFQAEVAQDDQARWIVCEISFAERRVLRGDAD